MFWSQYGEVAEPQFANPVPERTHPQKDKINGLKSHTEVSIFYAHILWADNTSKPLFQC